MASDGSNAKWSKEEVIDAIKGEGRWCAADGTSNPVNGTMRAACRRLKIAHSTWYKYRAWWPEIVDALAETREIGLDVAEEKLVELIDEGHFGAVKLMLESRGSSRGYGKRALIRADINMYSNPLEELSDDELDSLLDD